MTMFIKLENGVPASHAIIEDNFRMLFPGVSFAWPFTPEDVENHGFGIYDFSHPPSCGVFEKPVEVTPVRNENGIWIQAWSIEPMTAEEIQQRTNQEWSTVRSQRSFLMTMCDWTQLPDAKLTDEQRQAWSEYRQQLRDITMQDDPFNIQWPTMPNGVVLIKAAAL